jgi:tRNA (cytidine/uridine-2'-O-)-methyltransferase
MTHEFSMSPKRTLRTASALRLALFEPDIPANTGTMLRLGACLGVAIDVIEPAGFAFTVRELKRAALDYAQLADIERHRSWAGFLARHESRGGRLVLLTTKAPLAYTDFSFRADDTLLVGRESAGAPAAVHARADARVRVPLRPGLRSLNVALAAAMVLGEAMRQCSAWPSEAEASEAR